MKIFYLIKLRAIFELLIENNLLKWGIIKNYAYIPENFVFNLKQICMTICQFGRRYKAKVISLSVSALIKIPFCLSYINHTH